MVVGLRCCTNLLELFFHTDGWLVCITRVVEWTASIIVKLQGSLVGIINIMCKCSWHIVLWLDSLFFPRFLCVLRHTLLFMANCRSISHLRWPCWGFFSFSCFCGWFCWTTLSLFFFEKCLWNFKWMFRWKRNIFGCRHCKVDLDCSWTGHISLDIQGIQMFLRLITFQFGIYFLTWWNRLKWKYRENGEYQKITSVWYEPNCRTIYLILKCLALMISFANRQHAVWRFFFTCTCDRSLWT